MTFSEKKICTILLLCTKWFGDPLDITMQNRMLCEHFHLVDEAKMTFSVYCALLHNDMKKGNRIFDDAESIGVTVFGYVKPAGFNGEPDINTMEYFPSALFGHYKKELTDVDFIFGHFPSTYKCVCNLKDQLYPGAKTAVMVHAFNETFVQYADLIRKMDLVFCVGKDVQRECSRNSTAQRPKRFHVYTPTCPLPIIQETLLNSDRRDERGDDHHTTYVSGFHDNPFVIYKLDAINDNIKLSENKQWKIVTPNRNTQDRLSQHFQQQEYVEILCPSNEIEERDFYKSTSTYWLLPECEESCGQITYPMELVLAIGKATPIKTTMSIQDLTAKLSTVMQSPNPGICTLDDPSPDMKHALQEKAKQLLLNYLKDTLSAETHRNLVACVLGKQC